jgi:hypothetical protein
LKSVSRTLEALAATLSVESFVLAVDPFDPSDEGFLGGTTTGREFWRGLRGGGTPGALTFKDHCRRSYESQTSTAPMPPVSTPAVSKSKKTPASLLKSEVYAAVRATLRSVAMVSWSMRFLTHASIRKASGVRTAEMRWKNQGNLETYGVRLVGWPANIPMQNPSTLSAAQNRQILNALNEETMKFLPIGTFGSLPLRGESPRVPDPTGLEETASEMDVYVRYDDFPPSESSGGVVTGTSQPFQVRY